MIKSSKITNSIKENVVLTFELLGGVAQYADWAKQNPEKFYEHWIKLLPAELKADISVSQDFTSILEQARSRSSRRSLEAMADQMVHAALTGEIAEGEYVEIEDKVERG